MDGLGELEGGPLNLKDGDDGAQDSCDDAEYGVLCIQSTVVWGSVGNQVASFILQVCGGLFSFLSGSSSNQEGGE